MEGADFEAEADFEAGDFEVEVGLAEDFEEVGLAEVIEEEDLGVVHPLGELVLQE